MGAGISGCGWMDGVCDGGHVWGCFGGSGMSGRESRAFDVGVEVRRGSVLGPLLFIVVLEALSGVFGEGLPMGLLCTDGLVLVAETGELLLH